MKKIKVAEVITRLDWGGAPDIVRILCGSLDPALYDITLISGYTENPGAKTKEFIERFKEHIIVMPYLRRNVNPIYDFMAIIKLYWIYRKKKFRIIHTHTAKAGALGRLSAVLSRRSVIIHTPHGHNFYGYFNPVFSKLLVFIEKILAYFTDKIICLTELEKSDYIKFKVADGEKLTVIYQGLELDRFINLNVDKNKVRDIFNIKQDEEVIGMISRLEPVKGIIYFIEAARDLVKRFTNIKFLLVGEGSLFKDLKRKMGKMGIRDKFIVTGWREDMPGILSAMDVFVLASLNEAVGMSLIEAQAMGIPVVATRVGGIPEILKDNQTGILVPPKNPKRLAEAISYLLENRQKRLDMGKEGRAWVTGRFKVDDMVNKISDLYIELTNPARV